MNTPPDLSALVGSGTPDEVIARMVAIARQDTRYRAQLAYLAQVRGGIYAAALLRVLNPKA